MPTADTWAAIRAAVNEHEVRPLDVEGRASAAVLIPLAPYPSEPHIVLTVRSWEVEYHKGEISFPGGAADPDDPNLRFTALRESHEEVGIQPDHVEVLGEMSPFATRTGFHVTPFVGVMDRAPYPYQTSAIEVAEVLEVPLSHLLDLGNAVERTVEHEGRAVVMRSYRYNKHLIYGATAMMLKAFLEEVATRLGLDH